MLEGALTSNHLEKEPLEKKLALLRTMARDCLSYLVQAVKLDSPVLF